MSKTRFASRYGTCAAFAVGVAVVLSACAPSTPAPSTDLSESELSLSPASNLIYECVTDKGWDVTLTWDGGIESSSDTVPAAQLGQFDADMEECRALVDDRITSMQPEEISQVYQLEVATRNCLLELDYNVDLPPSEQQYIDTFHRERWSAYGGSDISFGSMEEGEWRTLNEQCPQPSWSLGAVSLP